MDPSIKISTLKSIARRHGRKPSAVRAAVNKGLIPKAERRGLGRARGFEWIYPPGTDKALKSLFKMQAKGYRGGALHFALWWNGSAPFGNDIVEYVMSVFNFQRKFIQTILPRGIMSEVAGDKTREYHPPDNRGKNKKGGEFSKILQARLDQVLKSTLFEFVLNSIREIDLNESLSIDQIKELMKVTIATIMKVWPGNIEASALPFLSAWLAPKHPPGSKKRVLVDKLVFWFHDPYWFEEFLDHIQSAGPDDYENARLLIKDDADHLQIMGYMVSQSELWAGKIKRENSWWFRNMGPFQRPELTARAATLGYLIGFDRQIQKNNQQRSHSQ